MKTLGLSRRDFVKGSMSAAVLAALAPLGARRAAAATVHTVSTAWNPVAGTHYGDIVVTMNSDFMRDNPSLWGIVNAMDMPQLTTFESLTIIGDSDWHERFTWRNDVGGHTWQEALGGNTGATALAGLHMNNSRIRIKRLRVEGVPGPGVIFSDGSVLQIEAGSMTRIGWPIHDRITAGHGNIVRNLSSADHWWHRDWGGEEAGAIEPMALRRYFNGALAEDIMARGELAMGCSGNELTNFTQVGDGNGWKCGGPGLRVTGGASSHGYLFGVNESFAAGYDPVLFPHLHASHDMEVIEHRFGSAFAGHQRLLMFIAYRFDTPAILRRCVYKKAPYSTHPAGVQLHTGAEAEFIDCDIIGWADSSSFAEIESGSSATFTNCRFYVS